MLRPRLAVLALAFLGLAWAGAHSLAHEAAARPAGAAHVAGHGAPAERYLSYLPTSLALCLTFALAIATGAALGRRWAGSAGRSLWLFGVVPVLGFAFDALAELPAHGRITLSGTAVVVGELVPAFLLGLAVQIPFALVVVGLAGRIIWLAEALARALASPRAADPRRAAERFARASTGVAALLLVGFGRPRAPPATVAA